MRNFHHTLETRKQSFISAFSICITLSLKWPKVSKKVKGKIKSHKALR